MKHYIARQNLITKLAALSLSALCFLQTPARAQGKAEVIIMFPSVGVAPGQRLSITLFNPNGTPVRAQAQARHSGGLVVVFADGSVRAGEFQSFDFNHSDILTPGDELTGRKQILPSVSLTFSRAIKSVVASLEIVDIGDGTSNTVFVGEIQRPQAGGNGNDTLLSGFGNDTIMGFIPGQTLVATIFNPRSAGSDGRPESVSGHVKVFDVSGNLIAQSPDLVIPPSEFRSFNFNRDEILLPGEPGTNRAQVRIKPFFTFESQRLSPGRGDDLLLTNVISFEVIDNSTGKTAIYLVSSSSQYQIQK